MNHDLMVAEQSKPWVGVWGSSHDVKMPSSVDTLIKSGVGSRKPVKLSELNDPRVLIEENVSAPERTKFGIPKPLLGFSLLLEKRIPV